MKVLAHCSSEYSGGLPLRRDLRLLPKHFGTRHTLATKAEQYDLIEAELGVTRIDGCDADGFLLNGDRYVYGAVLCTTETYFSWKPQSLAQVTTEALSFLDLIRPQPELILIGTGREMQPLTKELHECISSKGMFYEALSTPNAISTYNILNQEARKRASCCIK
ncbi:hypothetical protein WJX73_007540 [Symbiochloris irregularis]|uniref:NADH dehydrogenase [ubiquinone] 1 alpha subcomplex assembly factor 3 n=1 Tax=Symbiochloris irregularis TaxID=706552 RepID=A0AAW1NRI5_9CHLO